MSVKSQQLLDEAKQAPTTRRPGRSPATTLNDVSERKAHAGRLPPMPAHGVASSKVDTAIFTAVGDETMPAPVRSTTKKSVPELSSKDQPTEKDVRDPVSVINTTADELARARPSSRAGLESNLAAAEQAAKDAGGKMNETMAIVGDIKTNLSKAAEQVGAENMPVPVRSTTKKTVPELSSKDQHTEKDVREPVSDIKTKAEELAKALPRSRAELESNLAKAAEQAAKDAGGKMKETMAIVGDIKTNLSNAAEQTAKDTSGKMEEVEATIGDIKTKFEELAQKGPSSRAELEGRLAKAAEQAASAAVGMIGALKGESEEQTHKKQKSMLQNLGTGFKNLFKRRGQRPKGKAQSDKADVSGVETTAKEQEQETTNNEEEDMKEAQPTDPLVADSYVA